MEHQRISSSTQPQQTSTKPAPASGADSAGGAAPGGFLALLAALNGADTVVTDGMTDLGADLTAPAQDPAQGAETPLLSDATTDTTAASLATDLSALMAWQGLAQPPSTAVPAGSGQSPAATAPSLGSATPAVMPNAAPAMPAGGLMGAVDVAAPGLLLGQGAAAAGLVAQTASMDNAADLREGPANAAAPALGARGVAARAGTGQRLAQDLTSLQSTPQASTKSDATSASAAVLAQAASLASSVGVIGSGVAERHATAEGRHMDPASALVRNDGGWAAGAMDVAAGFTSSQGSARDSRGDTSGRGGAEGFIGGASGETTPLGDVGAAPDAFATAAGMADEDLLAEQISFWANQKLQSADVTVQRDGQPVEITVSLQGNEAHVAFRSDQEQTRSLLDREAAQLQALLQAQGLVLSGMSVGTSGQGRQTPGRNPGDERGAPARGTVVTSVTEAGPSTPRAAGVRVLDVFA